MPKLKKIYGANRNTAPKEGTSDNIMARAADINPIIDVVNNHTDLLATLIAILPTLFLTSMVRNDVKSVLNNGGAGTDITFIEEMSGTYSLSIRCYDAIGEAVAFRVTNKTIAGFTVIPDEDCTVDYLAILIL